MLLLISFNDYTNHRLYTFHRLYIVSVEIKVKIYFEISDNRVRSYKGRASRNYPHCLVLVGPRNGFKSDFTIEFKSN